MTGSHRYDSSFTLLNFFEKTAPFFAERSLETTAAGLTKCGWFFILKGDQAMHKLFFGVCLFVLSLIPGTTEKMTGMNLLKSSSFMPAQPAGP
ncbi:MAG: hypothetical protein K9K64_02900 [Desulfohalobiaceae bacterium]|nr:hypothetical protein [Desulfohalobiaceae bacterium]